MSIMVLNANPLANEENMSVNAVSVMNCCHDNELTTCYSDEGTELTELLSSVADHDLADMLECEIFTDFSDLLLDSHGQPFKLDEEKQQPQPVLNNLLATKRAAPDSSQSDLNADHNYYVSPKKACVDETFNLLDNDHDDIMHIRYLERRRKNNAASKRSRETKKSRVMEMEQQVVQLEQDNGHLKDSIEELERLTKVMKSLLLQRVSSGNQ